MHLPCPAHHGANSQFPPSTANNELLLVCSRLKIMGSSENYKEDEVLCLSSTSLLCLLKMQPGLHDPIQSLLAAWTLYMQKPEL